MTKLSNLEVIARLATEEVAAASRKDKQIDIIRGELVSTKADHEALLIDYDQLHADCESSESTLAMFKSNQIIDNKAAKKVFDEVEADLESTQAALESVQQVNELVSNQNKLLQEENERLKGVERESQVLKNDNRKLKDQVVRLKAVKPIKAPKVTRSYKQLQQANAQLNKYIGELVKYGNSAPQFLGGLKHSKYGVMDFIDCKPEPMGVKEKGGEEIEKMVQRVIIINKNNSTKVMTRIIGEEGLHTCKIPTGGTVQIDDEVRDHVTEYFKTLDEMNEKLKAKEAA